jgi:hypothetical protein
LERLLVLADGKIAYELRKPRKNDATHLVMTPVQFLAKLAAIIPPPRYPLLRFAGVLAPGSSWRSGVVPPSPPAANPGAPRTAERKPARKKKKSAKNVEPSEPTAKPPRTSLGEGRVRSVYSRINWAALLKRIYLHDVLACPCGGRRRLLADITDKEIVVAILAHLGLPTDARPLARARATDFFDAA